VKRLLLLLVGLVLATAVAVVVSLPEPERATPAPTTTTVGRTWFENLDIEPPAFEVTGPHKRLIEDAARLAIKTVPELRKWSANFGTWHINESTLPADPPDVLATGGIGSSDVHIGRISRYAKEWGVSLRLMLAYVLTHEGAHNTDDTERLPVKAEMMFAKRIGNQTLIALARCSARQIDKEGHWLDGEHTCEV
jgi:hypothetical protein